MEMPLVVKDCPLSYRQLLDTLYTLNFDGRGARTSMRSQAQNQHQHQHHHQHQHPNQQGQSTATAATTAIPKVLPPELAKRVLDFLLIAPVDASLTRVQSASSHDGVHPLSEALTDSEQTWWLTQPGTMPAGKGQAYLQCALSASSSRRRRSTPSASSSPSSSLSSSTTTLCRVRRVGVKIPPLPHGPLSVREFHLQSFHIAKGWHRISPHYYVDGHVQGWQTFDLPDDGCDVAQLRVVCTRNQMAEYLEHNPQEDDLENDDSNDDNDDENNDTTAPRALHRADSHRFSSVGFFAIRFE